MKGKKFFPGQNKSDIFFTSRQSEEIRPKYYASLKEMPTNDKDDYLYKRRVCSLEKKKEKYKDDIADRILPTDDIAKFRKLKENISTLFSDDYYNKYYIRKVNNINGSTSPMATSPRNSNEFNKVDQINFSNHVDNQRYGNNYLNDNKLQSATELLRKPNHNLYEPKKNDNENKDSQILNNNNLNIINKEEVEKKKLGHSRSCRFLRRRSSNNKTRNQEPKETPKEINNCNNEINNNNIYSSSCVNFNKIPLNDINSNNLKNNLMRSAEFSDMNQINHINQPSKKDFKTLELPEYTANFNYYSGSKPGAHEINTYITKQKNPNDINDIVNHLSHPNSFSNNLTNNIILVNKNNNPLVSEEPIEFEISKAKNDSRLIDETSIKNSFNRNGISIYKINNKSSFSPYQDDKITFRLRPDDYKSNKFLQIQRYLEFKGLKITKKKKEVQHKKYNIDIAPTTSKWSDEICAGKSRLKCSNEIKQQKENFPKKELITKNSYGDLGYKNFTIRVNRRYPH